ncbi:hypothetical protein Pfo_020702 [Paulownia fortunei]|nr:hypothetical protein Pfo_020702 [Paulownia fortunei]
MAAAVENGLLATSFRPVLRRKTTNRKLNSWPTRSSSPSVALHVNGSSFKIKSSLSPKDYLEQSKELMEYEDGGPPRWFSPLECGYRSTGSPLLLFLPGIDGVGLGLMLHHKRLGEIFDIWCLHIPFADRTPLAELVMLVESTVRSEHEQAAQRPTYLVGESLGASLALVVAAQNPDIDLVLILANPATSFSKSLLQNVVRLSDMIHKHLHARLHHAMSSIPGLAGIPSKGPVLLVGNHMMLGMDLVQLVSRFWIDQNIMVRTIAHPLSFQRINDGKLPDLSVYHVVRVLGGVPVSATNLYRLFLLKSHVLLYPGGVREAHHQKECKLIWPVEPEFVRMAARFGAKLIPFGGIGEDDVLQLLLDCDDQMKIPAEDILRNKEKAHEMYLEVQTEIQKCIAYLKEKREKDPYRNLLARFCLSGLQWLRFSSPNFRHLIIFKTIYTFITKFVFL